MVSPTTTESIVNKPMNWSSGRSPYTLASYSNKPMPIIAARTLHFKQSILEIPQSNTKCPIRLPNLYITSLPTLNLNTS